MSLETYGRYQLLKKLATGGMAQIYLARQVGPEGFEKLLVVKRILPHLAENEDFVTMFLDEARIAARLNHPNIVSIFDLGAQDDSFFIAMEFIHGEDIRRVWKHADKIGKPIPLALICRMIIDACAGLDYAHKKPDQSGRPLNIVHRDISPQNILVSFEGGVKVVDFGIAKAADQATVTKSGVLKGKYSYMSPEQAGGQPIDCRTDIFALGVVMYELLTGTRLFKRATDIQTLNAVSECKVAPPSEISGRIPPDLDAIVMKALAKDRKDRFSEARQLGAALESWLLANKIPSSSAQLAEFMHDIYAERLAREQEEGRLLIETAESAVGADLGEPQREKATPSLDAVKRQTKSMRGVTGSQNAKRNMEETRAESPGRSQSNSKKRVDVALESQAPAAASAAKGSTSRPIPALGDVGNPHTEASMPTQSDGRGRGMTMVIVGVAVVALLAVGAFAMFGGQKTAGFSLETTPPGAQVRGPNGELCVTPCRLDDLPPGELALTIEKADFKAEKRSVVLKAGVHEELGVITLAANEPKPNVVGSKDPDPTPKPPEPVMVELVFETEPPGATMTLGTEVLGPTPQTRSLEKGTAIEVKFELKGYAPLTESLTVGEGETHFALKALTKPNVKPPVVKPPEVKNNPPPSSAKGTVRFVVNPWALVECPQARFKDTTPFAPQQLPVGEYPCTFTNPDFPPQTRVVRVEADKTTKVSVTLQQ
ncbi:MAG: serine/threonine-protein kinase [Archangium sp.]